MDGSPDNQEPKRVLTRRDFLHRAAQHTGILGITALAGSLAQKNADKKPKPSPPPLSLQSSPAVNPVLAKEKIQAPQQVEEIFFKNFSSTERALAEEKIATQIMHYSDQYGQVLKADRVLDWEKTTLKPILKLDVPSQNHQFWSELLPAVMYLESEGKNMAESEAKAFGLTQLTESTAQETANKHGKLKFDLRIGWDNLRLSRFCLEDLIDRYGTDIFLLGYYAGSGFTDSKILTALAKKGVDKQDSIMEKGISSNQQLRLYIDHYRINIFNLGSEDGMEYLTKTVAAMRILREVRG